MFFKFFFSTKQANFQICILSCEKNWTTANLISVHYLLIRFNFMSTLLHFYKSPNFHAFKGTETFDGKTRVKNVSNLMLTSLCIFRLGLGNIYSKGTEAYQWHTQMFDLFVWQKQHAWRTQCFWHFEPFCNNF